jgi:hypothetical protein
MDSFTELFKKKHMGELSLVILMIIYLIMGFKIPDQVVSMVDNMVGRTFIILIVIYLFMNANPILAVVAALVAFDLLRRSSGNTGSDVGLASLASYAPSEEKKVSQFTAFNQFPYTLEQEVVAKMAPIVRSGTSITPASYKPVLDNLHDASPLSGSD